MNNVIVKSGLMLVFIILLILVAYAVYEYVQYQQGMHDDRSMTRRTIKDFDSKYKSFIKMLKAIIAQNKDNQLKLSQLSSEDTYIASQIKEKDKVIQRKISELDESLKQHGEDIENLDDEFKKLGDKIEKSKEIQGLIKTMRQKNNQLFGDLVMTSRQVTDTSSALWNAMTQVYNRYMKTTDNIEKLQKKTEENNKTKIDLVQKRLEFRGLMSSYIAEISDINRDIRDLNFHVGTQHDRFNELSQFVEINRTSIEGLYQNYNDNKSDIDRLNIELNEANLLRDQMSARLEAIRDEYTESDDLDVGDTLSDIRGFLDRVQIFVDVCKDAIEIVETANVIILQDINTLQTRIDIVNNRIDALEGKYDFLDERITELNTHNAEIESSLNEISDIHDDSRDDLTTLNEKYSTLETEIQSMQQDLSVNDTFIDNMDENMRALFNFRQNGNLITNNIQNRQFTDDNSAFDFRTHATASNGMTIGMGNTIDDNRNLRICKKESDNICLHFAMGDSGLNIMPQNVNNLIINDKNNSGLAQFDMTNNVIRMGGINESAALVLHNNTAYAKVEGMPDVPAPDLPPPPPPPPVVNVPDVPPSYSIKVFTQVHNNDSIFLIITDDDDNTSTVLISGGVKGYNLAELGNAYDPAPNPASQYLRNGRWIIDDFIVFPTDSISGEIILGELSNDNYGHKIFMLDSIGSLYAYGSYYSTLPTLGNNNSVSNTIDFKLVREASVYLKFIQVASSEDVSYFLSSDGLVFYTGYIYPAVKSIAYSSWINSSGSTKGLMQLDKVKDVKEMAIMYDAKTSVAFLKNDGTVLYSRAMYEGLSTDNFLLQNGKVLSNVIQISAGGGHVLLLKDDNTVAGTGVSYSGLIPGVTTCVDLPGLTDIIQVSAGGAHSLFLKSNNTVLASGHNQYGQCGNGNTTQQNNATNVLNLTNIVEIKGGKDFSIFISDNKKVYMCGRNLYGVFGNGTSGNYYTTPIEVFDVNNINNFYNVK